MVLQGGGFAMRAILDLLCAAAPWVSMGVLLAAVAAETSRAQ